jgi:hypothetical protein
VGIAGVLERIGWGAIGGGTWATAVGIGGGGLIFGGWTAAMTGVGTGALAFGTDGRGWVAGNAGGLVRC